MQTWTSIATAIGDLLALASAVINLAAAIRTRSPRPRGRSRSRQHH